MFEKDNKMEKLMELAADMQEFDEIPDELTQLINESEEAELSLDELDYVAAASSAPVQSFDKFMEMMKNKKV